MFIDLRLCSGGLEIITRVGQDRGTDTHMPAHTHARAQTPHTGGESERGPPAVFSLLSGRHARGQARYISCFLFTSSLCPLSHLYFLFLPSARQNVNVS